MRFLKRDAFPLKSRGPITALDWDSSLLRAAQSVSRGGKAEIVRFAAGRVEGAVGLGQPQPDPLASGARLALALRSLDLKPGTVVMGIPKGLVFLRTLSLPKPETPAELAAMVHFQISRDLPFRPEEAVIDFQSNERPPVAPPPAAAGAPAQEGAPQQPPAPEKVDVLVAVVKKEVVEHYQKMAEAAGFKLAALGLDSYANARALEACEPGRPPRTVALVTLRQEEVIIEVISRGSLVFSRTAPLAAPAGPAPGAEPNGTVTIETVRSLHNYEGLERHEPVEEILVVGAQDARAAMVKELELACRLPCRLLDPAGALGPAAEQSEARSGGLTVLGLALSAQDQAPWPFDFLRPKRPPAPRNRRRAMLIQAAAAVAALLCLLWGLRAVLLHQRVKTRERLQASIKELAGRRQPHRETRLRAKTIQDWLGERRDWLDHYAYLSQVLPGCADVYVTSISAGARGVLHLSIQARSGEILADIDKRLRQAGYELRPLAVTPTSDRYGYAFQSSLELTLPPKMKIDLAALKVPQRPADDGSVEGARPSPGSPSANTPERERTARPFPAGTSDAGSPSASPPGREGSGHSKRRANRP